MFESLNQRTQGQEEARMLHSDSFVKVLERVFFIVVIVGGFFLGFFLGGVGSFRLTNLLEGLVLIWFWTSSLAMLLVVLIWLFFTSVDIFFELKDHYRGYRNQILKGEGEERILFQGIRDQFSGDFIPSYVKWIYLIYSWPLVVVLFFVVFFVVIFGTILGYLFDMFDNFIKNRMIKKHLPLALLSQIYEVRKRAERLSKKHFKGK